MPETAFGVVFRLLRERRELSLRDLGKLGEIDHAYIQRFESGGKDPPPEETLERLLRHLKLNGREAELVRFLRVRAIDVELGRHALDDPDATPEILEIASTIVHRGTARPTPRELIERAIRAKAILDS